MDEAKIERYVRDCEQKGRSLYLAGYREGKEDGYADGKGSVEEWYDKGLEDMYEAIKKICDMPARKVADLFQETWVISAVLEKFKPMEILEALSNEEEKTKFEVGDEVIDPNGLKAIVTNTDTAYHLVYLHNGKTWKAPKDTRLEKTGVRRCMKFVDEGIEELMF